ncbi:GNAT family N-acetyltransferase [Pelomyxa schiedti]|nr:GNAT family N-acetyltransferase [Pelomyxa schiedti]
MFSVRLCRGAAWEFEGVLALQRANFSHNLSCSEATSEGFVTVQYTPEKLAQLHALCPSVIAVTSTTTNTTLPSSLESPQQPSASSTTSAAQERIVGYALVMHPKCGSVAPVLAPMFKLLETLSYKGRPLTDYRYYIMGQVCVDKAWRKRGVFRAMYAMHRAEYGKSSTPTPTERPYGEWDLCVTEVATRNKRSMDAHSAVGFVELHRYRDETDDWSLIALDLRQRNASEVVAQDAQTFWRTFLAVRKKTTNLETRKGNLNAKKNVNAIGLNRT